MTQYGSRTAEFLASIEGRPELQSKIHPGQPDLMGQVVWAIEHEQALTLDDILYRRTSLGLLGITVDETASIAAVMAGHLGWTPETQQKQLDGTLARLKATRDAIDGRIDEPDKEDTAHRTDAVLL